MSDEKTEPIQRKTRRRARSQLEVLQEKINDLQDLLDQVKKTPLDDPALGALLDQMEGVGRNSVRLATLMKAKRQLAAERIAGKSLAEASTRALEAMQREEKEAGGGKKAKAEPPAP